MNLSPTLQQAIEEIASSQGITPEQFITQTLLEKIKSLQSQKSTTSTSQTGLREQDGILVFETESLDHIDFNALIAQSRQERDPEQLDS
jgi:predicted transcriptional regulator